MDANKVDRALERANGDRGVAAAMLGMDQATLKNAIHSNDSLEQKWAVKSDRWDEMPPKTGIEKAAPPALRKPAEITIATDDLDFIEACRAVGLTDSEQRAQLAYQKFAAVGAVKQLQVVSGSMFVLGQKLETMATKAADRYVKDDYSYEVPEELVKMRQADQDLVLRAAAHMGNSAKTISDIQHNTAKIEELKKERERDNDKRPQAPAFGILMKTDKVEIHEREKKGGKD